MRSYHTNAPVSRRKHGQSPTFARRPKATIQRARGDTLYRTIDDNARLCLSASQKQALWRFRLTCCWTPNARGVRWLRAADRRTRASSTARALDAFWRSTELCDIDRGFGKQRALPLDAMTDPDTPEHADNRAPFRGVRMSTNKLPDAALFYAQRLNWAVFPLKPESQDTGNGARLQGRKPGLGHDPGLVAKHAERQYRHGTGEAVVLDFDSPQAGLRGRRTVGHAAGGVPDADGGHARAAGYTCSLRNVQGCS
jgi:hypothetical protein